MQVTAIDLVNLFIATIGAALGILSVWRDIERDRVKLKVVPHRAMLVGTGDRRERLCIEVINLSAFAVTISGVGVLYHGTRDVGWIMQPLLTDGSKLPKRLEPRESMTAYCAPEMIDDPHFAMVRCAFAKTQCDHQATGVSPALRHMAKTAAMSGSMQK
jgi:hypothetical protein